MKTFRQLPEKQQKKFLAMYEEQIEKTQMLLMDFEPTKGQIKLIARNYAEAGMYFGGVVYPGIMILGTINDNLAVSESRVYH